MIFVSQIVVVVYKNKKIEKFLYNIGICILPQQITSNKQKKQNTKQQQLSGCDVLPEQSPFAADLEGYFGSQEQDRSDCRAWRMQFEGDPADDWCEGMGEQRPFVHPRRTRADGRGCGCGFGTNQEGL